MKHVKLIPLVVIAVMVTGFLPVDIMANSPPEKPVLTGPTSGSTGTSYTYTATSTDPDGDQISYCFEWGDGSDSFCSRMVNSGQSFSSSHTWQSDGTYTVSVTAEDEHGATSPAATLSVSMPLSYTTNDIVEIIKPRNGVYFFGLRIIPFFGQFVFGDVTVKVNADTSINKVEFLLMQACGCGREIMHTDTQPPFEWDWNQDYNDDVIFDEGFIELMIKGYSDTNEYRDSITLFKVKA
jgi:hypothetical protein